LPYFTYLLVGVVHPERADINVDYTKLVFPDNTADIYFSIYKSKIAFTYKSEKELSINQLATFDCFAEEQVRVVIDSLGFLMGCGYDVEITQLIDTVNDRHYVFGVQKDCLKNLHLIEKHSPHELIQLYSTSGAGLILRRALADLRMAIRLEGDAPFYCYRAIECLSFFFISDKGNKEQAWQLMREKLSIDKEVIMNIKNLADPIRHGNPANSVKYTHEDVLLESWIILDKFISYIKSKQL
jgi:hypothetical protein